MDYERLIDNTLACIDRAETEWAVNYWSTNLSILMRRFKSSNYGEEERSYNLMK